MHVDDQPLFTTLQPIDVQALIDQVNEPWYKTLLQVGDVLVRLGVMGPRQAFTVPAGMLHRPVVPARSAVLMIEKAGVTATGD